MKPNFFTVLMVFAACLTLWLCVRECCKCALACRAVEVGVIKLKAK